MPVTTARLMGVLRRLDRAGLLLDGGGWTDARLLGRFAGSHDEAAFEALVRRHGPMVLGVCRRVLRNEADAEDAFQATFLILARKAACVARRELVGNWLYGVAYRVALKAKAMNARRRVKEREAGMAPRPGPAEEGWRRLEPLLDQELQALPGKYRAPVVLCDLQGKTRKEAAHELGWPEGTVAGRLVRARGLLAKRPARHGAVLGGVGAAALLSFESASACVPGPLLTSTVKAAALFAAGKAAAVGMVSSQVVGLTKGVLNAMLTTKFKAATAVLLAAALLTAGGALLQRAAAQPEDPSARPAREAPDPRVGVRETPDPKARLDQPTPRQDGSWKNVLNEPTGLLVIIRAVDARQHKLTVGLSTNAGRIVETTYTTAKDVKVTLEDASAKGTLDDVEAGQGAVIQLADPQKNPTVVSVHVVRVQLVAVSGDGRRSDADLPGADRPRQASNPEGDLSAAEAELNDALARLEAAQDRLKAAARALKEGAEVNVVEYMDACDRASAAVKAAQKKYDDAVANRARNKKAGPGQ
jgi:RNA polymerase sigma factor (sigma-70 family)